MTTPEPSTTEVVSNFDEKHPFATDAPEHGVTDPGELTRPLTDEERAAIASEYESLKGSHNG